MEQLLREIEKYLTDDAWNDDLPRDRAMEASRLRWRVVEALGEDVPSEEE